MGNGQEKPCIHPQGGETQVQTDALPEWKRRRSERSECAAVEVTRTCEQVWREGATAPGCGGEDGTEVAQGIPKMSPDISTCPPGGFLCLGRSQTAPGQGQHPHKTEEIGCHRTERWVEIREITGVDASSFQLRRSGEPCWTPQLFLNRDSKNVTL